MSDDKQMQLPLLETVCGECGGNGGQKGCHFWETCDACNGTGYILTDDGKAILELVRHNGKTILRESMLGILKDE